MQDSPLMTFDQAARIRAEVDAPKTASLRSQQATRRDDFVKISDALDLGTASPSAVLLPGPIVSISMPDATDDSVVVRVCKGNDVAARRAGYPLRRNMVIEWENPQLELYLDWDAQTGKTAQIFVSREGRIRSGRITVVQSGGVSINEGTSSETGVVTLVASTAVQVLASDSNRKVGSVQASVDGYYGSTVAVDGAAGSADRGVFVSAGQVFAWRNTAALFFFPSAGGYAYTLEET